MSKIDEMLKNEKVEWKKLGEVFITRTGYTPSKRNEKFWNNGTVSWFTIEDIRQKGRILEFANVLISEKGVKKEKFRANSIILSIIGTIGEYALVKTDFVVNQQFMVFTLREEYENLFDIDFVRYYFSNISLQCEKIKRVSNVPTIDTDRLLNFEIPIPTLKVQKKIAKTLDKFTNYVTELQSELQLRTSQYNYYRDLLLSEEYLNKLCEDINKNEGVLQSSNFVMIRRLKLADIGKVSMCKRIMKNQTSAEGDVPFYKVGTFGKKANAFISKELFDEYREKYSFPKYGDVLISASGTIGRTVIYDGRDAYFQDSNIVWIDNNEEKVLNKYLYYFYETSPWNASLGGTIARLYNDDIRKINISLPPIWLQEKVVEILDKFTELLSETSGLLPAEIEQRQKQYEYYREKLLTFDGNCDNTHTHTHTHTQVAYNYFVLLKEAADKVGVEIKFGLEWKTLGDIGSFVNGTGMPKKLFTENGEIGAIHYGHIYTRYNKFVYEPIVKVSDKVAEKLKKVKTGDLVIARTSENIDDIMKTVVYLGKDDVVAGGHSAIYTHKQNPKYMSYVFNGYYGLIKQKNKMARGVKVLELSNSDMEKIKIPLPPLPVQEHIVSILDKFDTLVNDIKEGLPREIELREKEYIYYRDKLLSFE